MKVLSATELAELRRITLALEVAGQGRSEPPRFVVRDLVADTHALKATAEIGDWPRLAREARALHGKASAIAHRAIADVRRATSMRGLVQRRRALLEETASDPFEDLFAHIAQESLRRYEAHAAQAIDALRAECHAAFEQAVASGVGTKSTIAVVSSEIERQQLAAADWWMDAFAGAARADAESLTRFALEGQLRFASDAVDSAYLAGLLFRSPSAPFSKHSSSRPSVEVARAAMAAHAAMRAQLSSVALALLLLRQLAAGDGTALTLARTLRFAAEPRDRPNASITELLADPGARDGALVEVEGLIADAEHQTRDGKRNTYLTVAPLTGENRPTLRVRAHFANLVTRGVVEGAYARMSGRFSAQSEWADGGPGLDLERPGLAASTSWTDRLQHAVGAIFEVLPARVSIQWTIVPRVDADRPGGLADFLHAQELRSFTTSNDEEE